MRRQVQLLVDHGDSAMPRVERIGRHKGLAIQLDVAGLGAVSSAEHFHERALARAVLANERMDLAGSDSEGNILQGASGSEALLHPAHLETRWSHRLALTSNTCPAADGANP